MLHVIYKDSVYEELVWMQAPSRSRSLSWCPRATNRWWWATRCSSTTRQWAATASWTPVSTRRLWACAVGYGPSRFWRAPRRRGSVHPPLKQVLERRQADSLAIIIVMGAGKGWWHHDWAQNCGANSKVNGCMRDKGRRCKLFPIYYSSWMCWTKAPTPSTERLIPTWQKSGRYKMFAFCKNFSQPISSNTSRRTERSYRADKRWRACAQAITQNCAGIE